MDLFDLSVDDRTSVNILNPQTQLDSAQYQCVAKSSVSWSYAETSVQVLKKEEYLKGRSDFK